MTDPKELTVEEVGAYLKYVDVPDTTVFSLDGQPMLPVRIARQLLATMRREAELRSLLRDATKAVTCCTIMSIPKEQHALDNFSDGVLFALDQVSKNVWTALGSPQGKPDYIWWERQMDPNITFVDSEGREIHPPLTPADTASLGNNESKDERSE